MCGDWTTVLNPDVDTQYYLHIKHKAGWVVLNSIEEDTFVDAQRVMHEWERWKSNKKTSQSRLSFSFRMLFSVYY